MRRLILAAAALMLGMAITAPAQAPKIAAKSDAPPILRITHGPTVEYITANTAIVAWSTNVSSGTVVNYGTDQQNLAHKAEAPWGALTHRVTLKNLQPNTTYYFKVSSPQGAGTGTLAESQIKEFQTKAANTTAQK